MSRTGTRRHDPLHVSHVVISLHTQAEMVHAAIRPRLDADSLSRVIEARDWLSKVIERNRER